MSANSWSVQDFFPWISDRTSPTDLQTFQHSLQTHRCWLHHHSFSIVSAMHSVSESRRTVGFRPCRTWDFPVPQHDWKISDQFWQQFLYSSFWEKNVVIGGIEVWVASLQFLVKLNTIFCGCTQSSPSLSVYIELDMWWVVFDLYIIMFNTKRFCSSRT